MQEPKHKTSFEFFSNFLKIRSNILQILLSPPAKYWDYRHAPPWPVYFQRLNLRLHVCQASSLLHVVSGIILSTKHTLLFVMIPWADLSHL